MFDSDIKMRVSITRSKDVCLCTRASLETGGVGQLGDDTFALDWPLYA